MKGRYIYTFHQTVKSLQYIIIITNIRIDKIIKLNAF